jgi:hypothetical protein
MKQNLSQEIPKFLCNKCQYNTSNKKDYNKHLVTSKHKIATNETLKIPKNPQKSPEHLLVCFCGIIFNSRTTLWRHKKTCISKDILVEEDKEAKMNEGDNEEESIPLNQNGLLEYIIKENAEFKNLIIELLKKETIGNINNNNTINNNISNNCNNKSFNLNVFLNEKCKDAMNMSEFIDTIKMQLSDLENFAHLGYADGVSKIFVQGINALDIHLRPIHCSDSKRETLYIKDNNEWIKETDDKPLIINAIKKVAFKNIKQINEWVKENPECKDPRTKKYDKYNKIVMNSMSGGTTEEQKDNIEKIVKNVTKAVTIDKYALKS